MARTAQQLRAALHRARSDSVVALPGVCGEPGITEIEALADRVAAIADLETQLAERDAEEAGGWNTNPAGEARQ